MHHNVKAFLLFIGGLLSISIAPVGAQTQVQESKEFSWYHPYEGTSLELVLGQITTSTYSPQGKPLSIISLTPDGSEVYFQALYAYDSKGRLILEPGYYDGDTPYGRNELMYDDLGRMTKTTTFLSDGSLLSHSELLYDSLDRVIQEKTYNEVGALVQEEKHSYDTHGNLVETLLPLAKFAYIEKILYKYDSQNRLVERGEWSFEGELVAKSENRYNEQGLLVESLEFQYEDFFASMSYVYDSQGRKISESNSDATGREWMREVWKYDSKGQIAEVLLYQFMDEGDSEKPLDKQIPMSKKTYQYTYYTP